MIAADLTALESSLPRLTDREVLRGMETAELESQEFELYAGEAERRNLDS